MSEESKAVVRKFYALLEKGDMSLYAISSLTPKPTPPLAGGAVTKGTSTVESRRACPATYGRGAGGIPRHAGERGTSMGGLDSLNEGTIQV
jgi:hypothetical protein